MHKYITIPTHMLSSITPMLLLCKPCLPNVLMDYNMHSLLFIQGPANIPHEVMRTDENIC